jgi:glycerol-3-phosphate acyltransferase PlsY
VGLLAAAGQLPPELVATSAGMMLGLWPYYTLPGLAAVTAWGVIFGVSRYVSVASISAALLFPVAYVILGVWRGWPVFGQQLPLLGFAVLVGLMILYKHRDNLARLRAGTEHRMGRGKARRHGGTEARRE